MPEPIKPFIKVINVLSGESLGISFASFSFNRRLWVAGVLSAWVSRYASSSLSD